MRYGVSFSLELPQQVRMAKEAGFDYVECGFGVLSRADGAAAAAAAVERVKQLGYLDDSRYARALVSELSERKGMSERGILQELLRRGVDRETAEEALKETELDECGKIEMLLNGKYHSRLADEKGRRQVFNALLRLGYSYSQVRGAMKEYEFDPDEEAYL